MIFPISLYCLFIWIIFHLPLEPIFQHSLQAVFIVVLRELSFLGLKVSIKSIFLVSGCYPFYFLFQILRSCVESSNKKKRSLLFFYSLFYLSPSHKNPKFNRLFWDFDIGTSFYKNVSFSELSIEDSETAL